jgi:hypothetical protein
MNPGYLDSVKKQFEYYKMLADKTIAQIDNDNIFWQYNEESNSIAIIVKHLYGNLLSRWTDFLTTDGEKDWRDRDAEFENTNQSRKQLLAKWEEAWKCLFDAIDSITDEDLGRTIYIRNMGHTIMEAFNRSLAHAAYHIGQIVFIGKMIQNTDWHSLSIPKRESKKFNEEKFSKPKHTEHFTDEFINKKK